MLSHFYLRFTSEGILSKPISNDCSFHLSILIFTERHLECTVIPLGAENWAMMQKKHSLINYTNYIVYYLNINISVVFLTVGQTTCVFIR